MDRIDNYLKKIRKNDIYLMISYIVASIIFIYAIYNDNYHLATAVTLFIFGVNMLFSCLDLKKRMIYMIFNFMIFFFLLSRPAVDLFRGINWWQNYPMDGNDFGLISIFISYITLTIGFLVYDYLKLFREDKELLTNRNKLKNSKQKIIKYIQYGSFILLVISTTCFFIKEIDKLAFMADKSYYQYYTMYSCKLPFVIQFGASMMVYSLCVFLATMPSKRISFVVLLVYIVSALPMLKIGVRNEIILNCLFAFVYYFLRDTIRLEGERKWIGRIEKICILVAIPAAILFMAQYSNARVHIESEKKGLQDTVVDFFYEQGSSFETLRDGYCNVSLLPDRTIRNYTFGGYIDYITYGTIGRTLFDTPNLGSGNNINQALLSNRLAHNLSYVVLGDSYLNGAGRGSSYILETYIDFGYVGLIVFNLIFGCFMALIVDVFKKHWFITTMILLSISKFFFMPRDSATGWSEFLISYHFWFVIIAVIIFAVLLNKLKSKMDVRYEN